MNMQRAATKLRQWTVVILALLIVAITVHLMMRSEPAAVVQRTTESELPAPVPSAQPSHRQAAAENVESQPAVIVPTPSATVALPQPVNEAELASKEFVEAKRCAGLLIAIRDMRGPLTVCQQNAGDPGFYAKCSENTRGYVEAIAKADAELQTSASRDMQQSQESFYLATARAAKTGNLDAQLCYAGSRFELERRWTEQEIQQYGDDAPAYVLAAFERGDWRVVNMLSRATRNVLQQYTLMRQITAGDELSLHRMNRLQRLGASADFARYLDTISTFYSDCLMAQEQAESEAWAQQMYDQHFAKLPVLDKAPAVCFQGVYKSQFYEG